MLPGECNLGTLVVALQYQRVVKKGRIDFDSRGTVSDLATATLSVVCLSTPHRWLPFPPLRQAESSLRQSVHMVVVPDVGPIVAAVIASQGGEVAAMAARFCTPFS